MAFFIFSSNNKCVARATCSVPLKWQRDSKFGVYADSNVFQFDGNCYKFPWWVAPPYRDVLGVRAKNDDFKTNPTYGAYGYDTELVDIRSEEEMKLILRVVKKAAGMNNMNPMWKKCDMLVNFFYGFS